MPFGTKGSVRLGKGNGIQDSELDDGYEMA
jgi:hypothetical protein